MTDQMLDLARRPSYPRFLALRRVATPPRPAPATSSSWADTSRTSRDHSVDVVISNCMINLSADKPAVFAATHRVLRPGGRLGVSDIVADNHLSPVQRAERGTWVGCIAGALTFAEYQQGLADAGFVDITITATDPVADGMHSAIIRARKSAPKPTGPVPTERAPRGPDRPGHAPVRR
jgi:SAM-dependent methyltransferase